MHDRDIFSRNKLSMAVALALASYGSAQAQEAGDTSDAMDSDEPRIEEVVTTGIRRSLEDTAALKMDSESIIEAVSAEEIGKLPDVSIAESLARLPGLTAQRLNGRGQVISVRGLAPDFTTALLNGREQVTAGDNRGVEFDQYPSEVLSRVVVYKTPDASLIGQGLAGTADLQTVRPLEHGQQTLAANVRYEWLENSDRGGDDTGTRYSATYIDQFADDTVGALFAVAGLRSPTQADWYEGDYQDDPNGTGARYDGNPKAWVQNTDLSRTGLVGVLDYEPNDSFRATVDMFYSEFDEIIGRRGLQIPMATWAGASLEPGYVIEDGLITSAIWTNVKAVGRNDADFRTSKLRSIGINTQWDAGENWTVEFDANHSSINRTDQILETYIGTGSGANGQNSGARDTVSFEVGGNGTVLTNLGLDYSDPNLMVLTDPQGWGGSRWGDGGQVGFNKFFTIDDEINQIRVSAMGDVDWGFVSNTEFGINITQREKDMDNFEELLTTAGGTFDSVAYSVSGNPGSVSIPSTVQTRVAQLNYIGIPALLTYNPVSVYNSSAYFKVPFPFSDVSIKSWNIQEDVSTAYAKFGFDTQMGNIPVNGNFGVQLVHTDQKGRSVGASGNFENLVEVPIAVGNDYWDVLPSFNLTFEISDDSFIRLAGARTLARPRMDDLRPGLNFNFDVNKPCSNAANAAAAPLGCRSDVADDLAFSAGGGNSLLEPWIANSIDVSYERYFEDRAGYLAVAVFYKDLETYIYNQPALGDFTGFPTPNQTVPPVSFNGSVNIPQNGEGGNIQGVEFALSLPGAMVSEVLDGFGMFLTYSITDSEIEPNGPGTGSKLPGLSEDVGNLTLYYEKDGFSSRVSARHRSDFLGEVSGFANGRDFRTVQEETIIDAQVSYMFQSGPMDGLTMLLQGNNLTDEPFVTFENNDPRQVKNFQQYGRSYLFGLSYMF